MFTLVLRESLFFGPEHATVDSNPAGLKLAGPRLARPRLARPRLAAKIENNSNHWRAKELPDEPNRDRSDQHQGRYGLLAAIGSALATEIQCFRELKVAKRARPLDLADLV